MLLLTAEDMRALDRAAIESGRATGRELMHRAGTGVVEAIERRWGSLLGLRALVLCGTGNNGGDGFVAARELERRGALARVVVLGDPARIRGDAREYFAALEGAGFTVQTAATESDLARIRAGEDRWDYALDALLGTGAHGAPEGAIAAGVQALRELDEAGTRVVAVDLPTGVSADTGEIARRAVRADLTVTFGAPKRGHVLYPARAFVGALEVVDIGLGAPPEDSEASRVSLATDLEMAHRLPRRDPRAHKNAVGRVLVVGGSPGLTGAVALAARAASRAGAGTVRVAVPLSLHDILEIKLTEEMTIPCPETSARTLAESAAVGLEQALEQCDVVALGSGLSRHPESAALARRLALECPKPVVIDADGLNALAEDPARLLRAAGPRVLTPHLGEMSRLTRRDPPALEARRIDAAREWARAWGVFVVLKGAPTVTASPDGRAIVNPTGNPGMATAGMGDVLTGIIAALIGQGLSPFDAASLGAFVHGRAGDRVARTRGPVGLTAGDVAEALPRTLRALHRVHDEALEKRSPR
jgi:NAD(P)H-hydrate epimerase